MNNEQMIQKLKSVGISFEQGLTEAEFTTVREVYGVVFPKEIRAFFSCALPVGDRFFNWRDCSPENLARFHRVYENMEHAFVFDLEHNGLKSCLGARFGEIEEEAELRRAVLAYLHESPRLVPFYGHRCFFDGMDDMPIVSFWQPVDSIFYGSNFEEYLAAEFLGEPIKNPPDAAKMARTGIWKDLIAE